MIVDIPCQVATLLTTEEPTILNASMISIKLRIGGRDLRLSVVGIGREADIHLKLTKNIYNVM